jgi:hypothetical protein
MLRHWLYRIIYYLLIVLVGGVGPLTYFDAFLPGHTHPYHLSFLEPPAHHHNPLPPAAAHGLRPHSPQAGIVALTPFHGRTPGLAQIFDSGLADGYVLPGQIKAVSHVALIAALWNFTPTNLSAVLPPLKKPPK